MMHHQYNDRQINFFLKKHNKFTVWYVDPATMFLPLSPLWDVYRVYNAALFASDLEVYECEYEFICTFHEVVLI